MSEQEPAIRFIGDMERMVVQPGDRFILTIPGAISREEHDHIQAAWAGFAKSLDPAPLLFVLDAGAKLGVIGAADAAPVTIGGEIKVSGCLPHSEVIERVNAAMRRSRQPQHIGPDGFPISEPEANSDEGHDLER